MPRIGSQVAQGTDYADRTTGKSTMKGFLYSGSSLKDASAILGLKLGSAATWMAHAGRLSLDHHSTTTT